MNWIIGIIVLVVIGYLLDREVYFYDGVHLGPRAQAWLYDRWSRKYDEGKRESQLQDDEILAQPLLDVTKDVPTPFVLDFATGTGRLSCALISRPEFKGRIVALDLSQGMLVQASAKLAGRVAKGVSRPGASTSGFDAGREIHPSLLNPPLGAEGTRVEFLLHQTLPLPFTDAVFDVVCAPTRGLDVESSIYIWSKLKERCRQGSVIFFISADLDEILHYSDRILVFFAGKVSQPLDATSTTVEQLGQLIGGKGWTFAGDASPAQAS